MQDLLNIGIKGLCDVIILNRGAPSRYIPDLDFAHFTASASFSV